MFWEINGLHIDHNVLVAQAGIRPIFLSSVVGEGHGLDIVIVGLVHYDPEQGTLAQGAVDGEGAAGLEVGRLAGDHVGVYLETPKINVYKIVKLQVGNATVSTILSTKVRSF